MVKKMRRILPVIYLLISEIGHFQTNENKTIDAPKDYSEVLKNMPDVSKYEEVSRRGENAYHPGKYKQVLNADKFAISAGDTIVIDYYISGYGNIKDAKIIISPSTDILTQDSFVINNLTPTEVNGRLTYGPSKENLDPVSGILLIGKILNHDNKTYTTVFDASGFLPNKVENVESEILNFETFDEMTGAPFQFHLITRKEILPGNYKFNFVLSYFDGDQYQIDDEIVEIKNMAWYEEQASVIEKLGYSVAVLTIIVSLLTIFDFFRTKRSRIKGNIVHQKETELSIMSKSFSDTNYSYLTDIYDSPRFLVFRKNFDGLLMKKDKKNNLSVLEKSFILVEKQKKNLHLTLNKEFFTLFKDIDLEKDLTCTIKLKSLPNGRPIKIFPKAKNYLKDYVFILINKDTIGFVFSIGRQKNKK